MFYHRALYTAAIIMAICLGMTGCERRSTAEEDEYSESGIYQESLPVFKNLTDSAECVLNLEEMNGNIRSVLENLESSGIKSNFDDVELERENGGYNFSSAVHFHPSIALVILSGIDDFSSAIESKYHADKDTIKRSTRFNFSNSASFRSITTDSKHARRDRKAVEVNETYTRVYYLFLNDRSEWFRQWFRQGIGVAEVVYKTETNHSSGALTLFEEFVQHLCEHPRVKYTIAVGKSDSDRLYSAFFKVVPR